MHASKSESDAWSLFILFPGYRTEKDPHDGIAETALPLGRARDARGNPC